jgi:hypothetical protein
VLGGPHVARGPDVAQAWSRGSSKIIIAKYSTLGSHYRYSTYNEIMTPFPPCLILYRYKIDPYIPRYWYTVLITSSGPGPLLCTDKEA